MSKVAKFVGLDVHKSTISMAVCEGGALRRPKDVGKFAHDVPTLLRRLERLGEPKDVHVAYEAGPTGYGLCRALRERGYPCIVIAPSKTPISAGDRVKTDRRDAARLARLLRAGELVPVTLPDTEQEALRDLVRLREDAMHAQRRARQQLLSFLLRHGRAWSGKTTWTQAHQAWIRSQRFESELQRFALEDYFQETVRLDERLAYLTKRLEEAAETLSSSPLFRALQSLRGVSTIVAATIVSELGDLRRFRSAPHLMSYVGLVPSERSSGDRTRRGRITKTGNPHLRRVLIQAAWHCHKRPGLSLHMKRRSEGLPPPILDIASKAQKRLHHRYWSLVNRCKTKQIAVVACARELLGFVWAIGQQDLQGV